MRTSHKRIHELINEEKASLTDEELFSSKAYAAYHTDITEVATNRYKRHIKVITTWDESPNSFVAYTDNKTIHINCGNSLTRDYPTRLLKHLSIIGLNAHETGHNLYTDFEVLKLFMQAVDNRTVYPKVPTGLDEDDEEQLNDYLECLKENDDISKCLIKYVLHSLANILEDIYIEDRVCYDFPGDFKTGIQLNNVKLTEDSMSVEEQINKELPKAMILINTILQYARIGDFNNSTGYKGELLDTFYDCIAIIDDAVDKVDAKARFDAANRIFIKMWPYVKEWIEQIKKDPSTTPQQVMDMLNGMDKEYGEGKGISGPSIPSGTSTPCKGKYEPGDGGRLDDIHKVQEVLEEEGGRIKLVKTDDIEENGTGKIEYDYDFEGSGYEKAVEDIERLLTSVAEEKADIRYNEELSEELQKESDNINYGNAHRNINITIHRINTVKDSLVQDYRRVSPPLLMISKRVQKLVSQKLKDESEGGRVNGLYLGRRLNARSLCSDDGKIFYNKKMPMDEKKLAVGILVDESGSMSCGDRSSSARATAIVLQDFCESLGIPLCIYGHTEHSDVDLYAYTEFDHPDKKDRFRLMDISARSSNRDGAALRFVAERLVKRPENTKLLFIISDGQPAATGYYGTVAEADLRGIKREYTNKGITMFAAAIGDDKENIERIYKEGFLDITDLNRLPVNLAKLIVQYLKK